MNLSRRDGVVVLIDPFTGSNEDGNFMGYLRSVPLLVREGITQFTFNPNWFRYSSPETFDAVFEERADESSDFDYRAPPCQFSYRIVGADESVAFIEHDHLCQIVSKSGEQSATRSTTNKIIRAYKRGQIDRLTLVVDSADFQLKGQISSRALTEELETPFERNLENLVEYIIKREYDRPSISFKHTHNLWLHEAAIEYEELMEERPERLSDLFRFGDIDPQIRTWDFLEFLASGITENDKDHIDNTVRPWVDRDISKIKTFLQNELQTFNYDRGAVRQFRDRSEQSRC